MAKKAVVLVAEDEPLIAFDLQLALCDAGFTVVLAASCEEAQRWLADERPGVAVLDVRLTDGECVAVAKTLVLLGVPFVVHTGVNPEECDLVFASGKFIAKAVDPQEIVGLVRSMAAG
ncbi:response regulator [Mesorhizobium muleiense]|uniref:response regulator n=1 Tax=Mesorhizobium muleiense TaxID=1004279 RepID=UPI001428C9D5|nr:response regulator [Mesorhizobium muleiense]MCF6099837.1 response regulator [Mesorhizobium muleiense]